MHSRQDSNPRSGRKSYALSTMQNEIVLKQNGSELVAMGTHYSHRHCMEKILTKQSLDEFEFSQISNQAY